MPRYMSTLTVVVEYETEVEAASAHEAQDLAHAEAHEAMPGRINQFFRTKVENMEEADV